jgi:predicted nucleotidyltransferase
MVTYDLDVLAILPSDDDFHRLYKYFRSKGAQIEDVYIYIEGMPVQFFPNSISPLHDEAIGKANEVQFEGVASKFVSVEYLIALLLTANRDKDKIRVRKLLDKADKNVLLDVIRRFNNGQLLERYEKILASKRAS